MSYVWQWLANSIGWVRWIWWGPMERLLNAITRPLGMETPAGTANFVWKSVFILLGFFILAEIYLRLRSAWVARSLRKSMEGHVIPEPLAARKDGFGDRIEGVHHPEKTIDRLRKEKAWGRIGEVFEALNQPDEAARWFEKDRQWERAARNWAAAGKTSRAARLLWKAGSWEAAARLYESIGKKRYAAKGFMRAGKNDEAARVWMEMGKSDLAVQCLEEFAALALEKSDERDQAIGRLWQLIESGRDSLKPDQQERLRRLARLCAAHFEQAGKTALAAHAFSASGDFLRAAKLFNQIGDAPSARRCLEALKQHADAS
ncbi:MAG TPA: hypothetical protein PLO53_07360 [Candidatus Hydrogenedentes bacterium]|nr:hypothetical protein [Candidatus Hydrogenedentota bacterium]